MPYVVTTKRLDSSTGWSDSGMRVSRRTVATLEEAERVMREAAPAGFFTAADRPVSEHGGTIGLPDGTVIEVRPA